MTGTTIAAGHRPWPRTDTSLGLLVALLVGICAFRIVGLAVSNAELYFDEAQYWSWAQEPAFGYFTKPPLIAWLIGAATSVCGDTPFCVRLPSPLIHFGTALAIYAVALRLFDQRTAFWSALVYNILPGASLSSTIMSTDVPLLFFWTLGLLAIVHHVARPSLAASLALGLCIGLGLNAKYAMAYLPACFVLYGVLTPSARPALKHPGTWLGFGLALLMIVPNLWWNASHGFATFAHTGDNISFASRFPNFVGVLEFVGNQLAIISPVPFAALVMWLAGRGALPAGGPARLLAFHSMPVFLMLVAQAFLSKANGNWAATAFPAATILAVAVMLALDWRRGMIATLAICGTVLAVLSFIGLAAGSFKDGPAGRELSKYAGWGDFARNVERIAKAENVGTVVFWGRALNASMVYELRNSGLDVRAFLYDPTHPGDHFEMTRPWRATDSGPVIYLAIGENWPPEPVAWRSHYLETFPTEIFLASRAGGVASAYRVD